MEHSDITREVISAAYAVHNVLGSGFLEKVYEKALLIELRARGLVAEAQVPISVFYREQIVGEYYADLLVFDTIVLIFIHYTKHS